MKTGCLLTGFLSLVGTALAQQSAPFCDSSNGICFQANTGAHGLIVASSFPRDAGRDEFIGQFTAPLEVKWAGYALGGSMAGNILVVAWPNGNDFVFSTRMASDYTLPGPYSGPVITKLPSSSINSTHWKFLFRCQGCTKWTARDGTSGAIAANDFQVQSWALSTKAVNNPSDPNSSFDQHTDFGTWGQDIPDSRSDSYDTYLSGSGGSPSTAAPSVSATDSAAVSLSLSVSLSTGLSGTVPVTFTQTVSTRSTNTNRTVATGTTSVSSTEGSAARRSQDLISFGTIFLAVAIGCLVFGPYNP